MSFFAQRLPDLELGFLDDFGPISMPAETQVPTVQNVTNLRSEVLHLDPTIGVPSPSSSPRLVTSAALPSGDENEIPAPAPVFFPTALGPGLIKSSGENLSSVPALAQSNVTATVSQSRFSNVDLGLATLAGLSILTTGAVALIRR